MFINSYFLSLIFTTIDLVFQGGTIKLLVDLLNINKAEDEQKALLEELTDSVIGVEHFIWVENWLLSM